MDTKQSFSVALRDDGSFEIPIDVRAVYGQARPAVKMTFCGETYPTRVMVYGGKYTLGIWKAVLAKHGLQGGQTLDVTLEPDTENRTIEPPDELAAVLKKNAAARTGWAAMSHTHQREWAQAISDAKKPETRARRVEQAVEALVERGGKSKAKPKPKAKASKAKAKSKPRGKAKKR
jgi:hypothetical protein